MKSETGHFGEWIRTRDAIPEKGVVVLGCCRLFGRVDLAKANNSGDGLEFLGEADGDALIDYWMLIPPLPDLPGEWIFDGDRSST